MAVINISTGQAWTDQTALNLTEAATVSILNDNSIVYDSITVTRPRLGTTNDIVIDIANPSADPTPFVTKSALNTWYTNWQNTQAANLAAIQAENSAVETAYNNSYELTWSQIETKVDSIWSGAQATFMKELLAALRRKKAI